MHKFRTRSAVVKHFRQTPKEVQYYFEHLRKLVEEFPWDVCLSYMFSRVELAQNMTLYCGIVKIHRGDSTLARKAIDAYRITRTDFKEKFKAVFGKPIPQSVAKKLETAEKVRDRVMHGKSASEQAKREAVVSLIEYAKDFNDLVNGTAGFRPFGKLRGFKGRSKPLDKSTTRWLLKGMDFNVS